MTTAHAHDDVDELLGGDDELRWWESQVVDAPGRRAPDLLDQVG